MNVAGGGGIYRAGGPTTIFGGSGWGPFSDGPLNAVRKSLLSRDGVTEENWMWMMAGRVGEADEEWARLRKERKGRAGLAVDGVVMGGKGSAWERPGPIVEKVKVEKNTQVEGGGTMDTEGNAVRTKRKNREEGPVGVYEPHTNMVLYRTDTQPTRATWQQLPSSKRRILGGTRAGNGAWSLAWVDTVMQLPQEDQEAQAIREKQEKEREALVKESEDMFSRGGSVIPRDISVPSPRGMSVGV